MKKNAFTLIELLGVISILGLIILVALPTVEKNIKISKQKLYEAQISNIESGLKNWATDNVHYLPENDGDVITLTLFQLKQGDYISNDIMNPLTDELFPDDMLLTITKKVSSLNYKILDDTGTSTRTNEVNPYAPVLLLNGEPVEFVEIFDTYIDLGVTAIDSDGNTIASSNVVTTISGTGTSINTNNPGNYTIKYEVTDPDNGYKTTITRTVIVGDRIKPILVVPNSITLASYEVTSFNARTGASASDNYDGDLTSQIVITGSLSILPGTYYLTYTVTDSSGNMTTGKRTVNIIDVPLYADTTGAPIPELSAGMIPIKWNGTAWIKADITQKWYDYSLKEWANVVLVTESTRNSYKAASIGTVINESDVLAYLVWIPRYKYRLFNVAAISVSPQTIEISFESKTTAKSNGSTNGTWLTHPAFTFDNYELNGIWVGKFETTGDATTPTVKPNTASLRNQNVSTQFATAQKFNNLITYGSTSNFDAHMMKNMEWGAVTYLAYSIYGKNSQIWQNNSSTYITGCTGTSATAASVAGCQNAYNTATGINASSTGNIYGVYDMIGGSYEYVMGGMYSSNNTTLYNSSSGFPAATIDGSNMAKYIDKYTYGTTATDQAAFDRRLLGDATGETKGWYSAVGFFMSTSSGSWFARGGPYLNCNYGAAYTSYSFRLVQLKA